MCGIYTNKEPKNEVILSYAPGSRERNELKEKLAELKSRRIEIPLIIGGKEIKTGKLEQCLVPHNHRHILADYHLAGPRELEMAVEAALHAKKEWEKMSWEHRASIFLKAAEMVSGSWRMTLNAATMLGQSKTAYQDRP